MSSITHHNLSSSTCSKTAQTSNSGPRMPLISSVCAPPGLRTPGPGVPRLSNFHQSMRTPGPGARTPGLVCKPCAPRGHPHTHRLSGPRILLLRLSSALSDATVAILAQGTHWVLLLQSRPFAMRGPISEASVRPPNTSPSQTRLNRKQTYTKTILHAPSPLQWPD